MKTLNTIVVVSNDEKDRYYWEKELSDCKECEIIVTDSVIEAISYWNKCYVKGTVPKAIIANWVLEDCEVETFKDGICKSGSHYLLDYCTGMVENNEVKFVIYTAAADFVQKRIKGLREEKHTTIISKQQYSIHDAFAIIKESLKTITNPSGFHSINHA